MKIWIVKGKDGRFEWEIRSNGRIFGISMAYFNTAEEAEKQAKYVVAGLGATITGFEYADQTEESE